MRWSHYTAACWSSAELPAQAIPILMYHHVAPAPGLVTMSPDVFREQIAAMTAAGWRSIGTSELESFHAGLPLPDRSFMITFDDGYYDNFAYAHPVLAEFGQKAVLFLVTAWLGEGNVRMGGATPDHAECKRLIRAGQTDAAMLRWSEIEAMAVAGTFEFHSHTHTHTRWDRQIADPVARDAALGEDLALSREILRRRLGFDDRHLCWPQGYFDEAYQRVARAAGFDFLYTTRRTLNCPAGPADSLGRLVAKEQAGGRTVRRLFIQSRPWLARLYACLQGGKG